MNEALLTKILDSDITKDTKDKIMGYWLLPQSQTAEFAQSKAPIQKTESRSGSIKRPTKEQIDLKNNPRVAEEIKAMEETLGEVLEDEG